MAFNSLVIHLKKKPGDVNSYLKKYHDSEIFQDVFLKNLFSDQSQSARAQRNNCFRIYKKKINKKSVDSTERNTIVTGAIGSCKIYQVHPKRRRILKKQKAWVKYDSATTLVKMLLTKEDRQPHSRRLSPVDLSHCKNWES